MKTQLLLEVETPDVARHAAEVQTDLRQLIIDSLNLTLKRHPSFRLHAEIKTATGTAAGLLTKQDVAIHTRMSTRNVERCVKEGRIPEPVRIAAPHCTKGSPRWFAEDILRHD
jgi:endonuclease V-like protein UPF0215 family